MAFSFQQKEGSKACVPGKDPCSSTCAHIDCRFELAIVLRMVIVEHLEKVGVVTGAEGLVESAVKGLAREGGHGEGCSR